jgi:hypothetical protein
MLINFKGRLLDVNVSKGKAYATFNDTEQGGQFKMTFPGLTEKDLKIDGFYDLSVQVKPGYYDKQMFLTVVDIKSNSSGEKGENK